MPNINLNLYGNVLSKWKLINTNIINTARVINDILDINNKDAITWTLIDDENNEFTVTMGGIADIIGKSYARISDGIDRPDVGMTSSEYNSLRQKRIAELKVSGPLSGFMTSPYYGNEHFSELNGVSLSTKKDIYMKSEYDKNRMGMNVSDVNTKSEAIYNVDGHFIYYNNNNSNDIIFPEPDLPKVVTDAKSLNVDLKPGDMFVMTDKSEILSNGTFDTGIDGWHCTTNRGYIDYDSDNKRLKFVNTSYSNYLWCDEFYNLIPGAKYKITIDVTLDSATNIKLYTGQSTHLTKLLDGVNEAEFIYSPGSRVLIANETSATDGTDKVVYINSASLSLAEDVIVSITNGAPSGSNFYHISTGSDGFGLGSRQDLFGLEVWIEKVSDRDFVYPYGDVQNQKATYSDLLPITQVQSFTDKDTYSKYGAWEEDGNTLGRGYKWSTLSKSEQNIILGDSKNNLFIGEDGEVYQVRYRRRTIKGNGNLWDQVNRGEDMTSSSAYSSTLGYTCYKQLVRKFTTSQPPYDITKWNGVTYHYFNNLDKYRNNERLMCIGEYSSIDTEEHFIPIAKVQRRNLGIYHPVYNPYGSALIYYDTDHTALKWYELEELDNTYITSVADCMDPNKISVVNDDGTYSNLASQPDYYITGTIQSKVSGRPDELFADGIYERDVEDIREAPQLEEDEIILDKYKNMLYSGNFRTRNTTPVLNKVKHGVVGEHFGNYRLVYDHIYITWGSRIRNYNRHILPQIKEGVWISNDDGTYALYPVFINVTQTQFSTAAIYKSLAKHNLADQTTWYTYEIPSGFTLASDHTTGYSYNSKGLITEVWGDPRKLSQRVEYTVTSTDEVISLSPNVNVYLLCTDTTNNNGTLNHIYRYKGDYIASIHTNSTDGDPNANNGHIDFSDANIWADLGTGDDIAGLIELDNYGKGFNVLNFVSYTDGNSTMLPYKNLTNNRITILLTKPINEVKEVFIRDANGLYKLLTTDNTASAYYSLDTVNNLVHVYINDPTGYGYNNIDECIDKTMVLINYIANVYLQTNPDMDLSYLYTKYQDDLAYITDDSIANKLHWSLLSKPLNKTGWYDHNTITKITKWMVEPSNLNISGHSITYFRNNDIKLYNTEDSYNYMASHFLIAKYRNLPFKHLCMYSMCDSISAGTIQEDIDIDFIYNTQNYTSWWVDKNGVRNHRGLLAYRLPYLITDETFKR